MEKDQLEWLQKREDFEMQIILDNSDKPAALAQGTKEEPKLSSIQKFRLGISRRTVFLVTMFLLLGMAVAGIVKTASMTSPQEDEAEDQIQNALELRMEEALPEINPRHLLIDSATDLKSITTEQDTIIVYELNEDYIDSYSFTIHENRNIKNLIIDGTISSHWLRFLLRKFTSIISLELDLDDLCSVNFKDIYGYSFNSITKLVLSNLFHCEDIKWINEFRFPKLLDFHIVKTDLSKATFGAIREFLRKSRNTLIDVHGTNCVICRRCDLNDTLPQGMHLNCRIKGN